MSSHGAAVPTVWHGVLDFINQHPDVEVSTLKEAIVGGAACPAAMIEAFGKLDISALSAWGMTELSPVGASARAPKGRVGAEAMPYRTMQGRFLAPVRSRLSLTDGSLAPHDGMSIGELEVSGPWVTGSYLGGHGADRFTADG
jgi:fatty-acyl-CoA synthase